MSASDLVSPPSARSRVTGWPRSAAAAPARTATLAAIPSTTARTTAPRSLLSASPPIAPRAAGAQYGAASPASAGTNVSGPAARPAAWRSRSASSGDHAQASRSSRAVRLAVAASVTNWPVSLCSSQASVVVTTPSVTPCSRSQVIFGAAK
jgi:hypothetical protein